MQSDADRTPCRHESVARPQPLGVDTLPRIDRHVEMAGRIRTVGVQGKARPIEELARIRFDEELVGVLPVAARGRVTRVFQEVPCHRAVIVTTKVPTGNTRRHALVGRRHPPSRVVPRYDALTKERSMKKRLMLSFAAG